MSDKSESVQKDQAEGVDQNTSARPDNRRFLVSGNRGSAVHKVRYVEQGGGEATGACRLCTPVPAAGGLTDTKPADSEPANSEPAD